MMNRPEFMEFPCYTRDDIFDTAISLELNNSDAFELSEFIRKGKVGRRPEALDNFNLPDLFKKMAVSKISSLV